MEKKKIVYMIRTKPKYQFPLTDEEREELNYFVTKVYNPMTEDFKETRKNMAHV
jgi:hypothetical protein